MPAIDWMLRPAVTSYASAMSPLATAFYVIVLLAAAGLNLTLAFFAEQRRKSTGARACAILLLLIGYWVVLSAIHALLGNYPLLALTVHRARILSVAFIPVVWFVLAVQYSGNGRWLNRNRVLLLCLIPLTTVVISLATHLCSWLAGTLDPNSPVSSTFDFLFGIGLWGPVHVCFSYLLIFSGISTLLLAYRKATYLERRQILVFLGGILLPLGFNVALTFRLYSYRGIDYTALAFGVSGAVFAWALFHQRLFDIVPVARETLVDQLQDAVLVIDDAGRVVHINPAAAQWLALQADTAIGQSMEQIFKPWQTLLARSDMQQLEHDEITLHRDGQSHELEASLVPLYDERQMLVGRLLTLHDVTRRKVAEHALRNTAAELEASNIELDAFAHTVAHDLRAPITLLMGYSSLVEDCCGEMEVSEIKLAVSEIYRAAVRLNRIVSGMLLLASVRRMEDAPRERLNLALIVREVLVRLESPREEVGGSIETATVWPPALGYAPWVEEALVNYVSNALKYGGRPPQVIIGGEVDAEGMARLWVRDNGPGVSVEDQGQLFTEFSRLGKSRTEGHGLGLSIVRRIIERLGGQVGVDSRIGEGSTFWFTLPLAEEDVSTTIGHKT